MRCFRQKWGHLYSFWHQYLCCNVKSDWFCSVQLCWSCINFRFSIADIFHGIISFWEKTTVPSFKHLSQCSVNIICAISLLFLIQSRQQLKVKWFPISWNTFSFNRTMKKHRDSNIKCLQRVLSYGGWTQAKNRWTTSWNRGNKFKGWLLIDIIDIIRREDEKCVICLLTPLSSWWGL